MKKISLIAAPVIVILLALMYLPPIGTGGGNTTCPNPNQEAEDLVLDFLTNEYAEGFRVELGIPDQNTDEVRSLMDITDAQVCQEICSDTYDSNQYIRSALTVDEAFYFIVFLQRLDDSEDVITTGHDRMVIYNQDLDLLGSILL